MAFMRENKVEFKTNILDSISPTFCAAKWYKSTIWLNNGTTASCCHCSRHHIDKDAVVNNPSLIHNTELKKINRHNLLRGNKDPDCKFCWDHENLGLNIISDRTLWSYLYSDEELFECKNEIENVQLKTAEIAFDTNCNFACMYCDANFSTKWQSDIKRDGPYTNLESQNYMTYMQDGSWSSPYGLKNIGNPFVEAFWKWWNSDLHNSITELRVTGGEPTMSPEFWKLVEWFQNNEATHLDFAVNTNFGITKIMLDRLLSIAPHVKTLRIYTSNESFGAHAEYIRDGLIWDNWLTNLHYVLTSMSANLSVRCTMTINALNLFSVTEFLDAIIKVRREHLGIMPNTAFMFNMNILQTAIFMKFDVLPISLLEMINEKMETWKEKNIQYLNKFEVLQIERTIQDISRAIRKNDTSEEMRTKQIDLKTFITQFDKRRGKNFNETFSDQPALIEWFKTIPIRGVNID